MTYFRFYQVPASPLARFLLALGVAATLVLAFFLGLAVLAVAAGLALIGALYLGLMRLIYRLRHGRGGGQKDDLPLEGEYRVVRRERDR